MNAQVATITVCIAACLVVFSASAATTTIATRERWEFAVGAFDTENFENTPLQGESCSNYISMQGCAHEFTFVTEKLNIVIPDGSDGMHRIREGGFGTVNGSREFFADLHGQILLAGVSFNRIVFPDEISAFGVDLANVFDQHDFCPFPDPACGYVPQPMSISGEVFVLAAGTTFFCAVSDTPFSSVTIQIADRFQGNLVLPVLDNISFVVVPGPTAGVLVLLGLAILSRARADQTA